jgi:hypothetical protein
MKPIMNTTKSRTITPMHHFSNVPVGVVSILLLLPEKEMNAKHKEYEKKTFRRIN